MQSSQLISDHKIHAQWIVNTGGERIESWVWIRGREKWKYQMYKINNGYKKLFQLRAHASDNKSKYEYATESVGIASYQLSQFKIT